MRLELDHSTLQIFFRQLPPTPNLNVETRLRQRKALVQEGQGLHDNVPQAEHPFVQAAVPLLHSKAGQEDRLQAVVLEQEEEIHQGGRQVHEAVQRQPVASHDEAAVHLLRRDTTQEVDPCSLVHQGFLKRFFFYRAPENVMSNLLRNFKTNVSVLSLRLRLLPHVLQT